jgi:hypothetical protein
MDPSTLVQGPTGFDVEPNVPMSITFDTGNFRTLRMRSAAGCTTSATCTGFAPGTYTFTFHQGATVKDFLGNTFTNPTDVVIHFTIKDPDPNPDCLP